MGAGRGDQRTIFLIEEDDETRPLLKANLQSYGYRVLVALDEEDARERAGGGPRADLILVNLVGKTPAQVLEAGRGVRERVRFDGHIPLVVVAEKYGPDLEGTNVNVSGNDWITYPEDHHQLKNLLARLLHDPPN